MRILHKILLLGYEFDEPGETVFLNTVLLFLCLNIGFSLIYWFALLTNQTINIGVWEIDVPQDYPVKYFAENITKILFISLPVSLFFFGFRFLTRQVEIYTFLPFDNTIKIADETLSQLKLNNKNFVMLKVSLLLCIKIQIFLFLLLGGSRATYQKFYDSVWYNGFFDWKNQDFITLLNWNLFFLLVFFFSFFLFLEGTVQALDIFRHRKKFLERLQNLK